MGLYIKKSISVGPFRFNLSKSGVGVSAGVKGFRVGTGPRGNYVHMGVGGLYYRSTLPKISSPNNRFQPHPQNDPRQATNPPIPSGTHDPLVEIDSADVSQLVDSSSKSLLDELNQKKREITIWPFFCAATLVILWIASTVNLPTWALFIIGIAGLFATHIRWNKDTLNKNAVLMYDFDPEMERAYEQFLLAAERLSKCSAAWHIEASSKVHDSKYHAGASNLIRRSSTSLKKSEPPYLKTNIEVFSLEVGKQVLYFFPDKVLVYQSNCVGAVDYKNLHASARPTRFIEDSRVPNDSAVVDRTWQYVNKSGGPDRRFKDNRELPVCLYEELSFSSETGLNEVLQFSKSGSAADFCNSLASLARKTPPEIQFSDVE
jgi:hypothetical protein